MVFRGRLLTVAKVAIGGTSHQEGCSESQQLFALAESILISAGHKRCDSNHIST